ncbi:MAG: hypothetical protein ACE5G8_10610, partial [Anaerolineae bacterium]
MSATDRPDNPNSEQSVSETTPPWLLALLRKYGESEGILDGAPIRSPESMVETQTSYRDTGPTDISDALEDLAASMPATTDRLASSVDWGPPSTDAEPASSSAMDELLASFQETDAGEPSPPPSPPTAAEIPDWLDEAATAPLVTGT